MQKSAATKSRPALVDTYESFPLEVVSGRGATLTCADGRELWDFYGGHAVALIGHSHPAVAAAIAKQAETLAFYSNVLSLPIREQAAARLASFTGGPLGRVFFCNSGAEANENALKLAIKQTGRVRLAALEGAFHGRTLLALAATAGAKLHSGVSPLLCDVVRIKPNDVEALQRFDDSIAALIVEPILSIAGIVELSADFLRAARKRCDEIGAKLIFDEVQTGMGRLGRPLASGDHGVWPDMATLAKGIANGVPMGAVLMGDSVADNVKSGDLGSTFGGGPLACAAMLAVVDELESQSLVRHAAELGRAMHRVLRVGPVRQVLGRGCLIGLRLDRPAPSVQRDLMDRGFVTGTSGDAHVLRLMPPLNMPVEAVAALAEALETIGAKKDEASACLA